MLYYNFTSPGVYNVTLKVVDSVNFTAVNSVTIKVNNYPTLNVSYNLCYDFLVYASSVNLFSKVFGGTLPYTYTVYVNGREYYVGNNLSINVPIDAGKNNIAFSISTDRQELADLSFDLSVLPYDYGQENKVL